MPFRYHASDGLDHDYHPLSVGQMPGTRQDCVCQSAEGEQTNVSHLQSFRYAIRARYSPTSPAKSSSERRSNVYIEGSPAYRLLQNKT